MNKRPGLLLYYSSMTVSAAFVADVDSWLRSVCTVGRLLLPLLPLYNFMRRSILLPSSHSCPYHWSPMPTIICGCLPGRCVDSRRFHVVFAGISVTELDSKDFTYFGVRFLNRMPYFAHLYRPSSCISGLWLDQYTGGRICLQREDGDSWYPWSWFKGTCCLMCMASFTLRLPIRLSAENIHFTILPPVSGPSNKPPLHDHGRRNGSKRWIRFRKNLLQS